MNAERHSLQDAFAPTSSRGSKLAGLLPPKRRSTEQDEPVRHEEHKGDRTSPSAKVADETKQADEPKASDTVDGPLRNVGVYVEPELLTRLKGWTRRQQITYADLLVEAFDHVEDPIIAKELEPEQVSAGSGMPRRVRRPRGTAGIQIQLRLDRGQVEWLDKKAETLRAPSRSACVSTVFKLHMDQLQQKRSD